MVAVHLRSAVGIGALLGLSLLLPAPSFAAEESKEDLKPVASSESLAGNYLAARIAATDKDMENAVAFYRKALKRDPENSDLKLKAFLSFVANGDFDESVRLGTSLAEAEESPDVVSLVLGTDQIRRKGWANAERTLTRKWKSPLDRLIAGLLTAWVQQGQGKTEEALATVDALSGPAWYDLFKQYHGGLIALASGDGPEALKRIAVAVENRAGGRAAPDTYGRATLAFIHTLHKEGQQDKALTAARSALRNLPQNPVFESVLANLEAGQAPKFGATAPVPGSAEVFLNLGTAINREGGEQFARIYMQLATLLATKSDVVNFELAELYDKQERPQRANELFSQIGVASPYHQIARLEIALNLDEMGQIPAAREVLDKLVEEDPDDLVLHLSYGAVLARHENYTDAITIYKRLVDRIETPAGEHWNLFYRLGIAYERTKQWPLAEEAFKQALKLYPDQPSVLNYLGYSWVDMNINLQEGLDMIRKAVSLRPEDGYMVDSLGWAYYRLGRIEEAVVQLERAVELRPGDPTINDHLGDAYWRAKRRLEATFQWNHALALDPPKADIPRIKEKLKHGLDVVLKREAAEAKLKAEGGSEEEG